MHVPTPQKNSPTSIRNLLTKVVKKKQIVKKFETVKTQNPSFAGSCSSTK